jgi:hypothetical protein
MVSILIGPTVSWSSATGRSGGRLGICVIRGDAPFWSLLVAKRTLHIHVAMSAFDPTATLAVHCGNAFDAGFNPYRNTR